MLPRFKVDIIQEHPAYAVGAVAPRGQGLAIGAEGHAPDEPLAPRERVAEPAAPGDAIQDHPVAEAAVLQSVPRVGLMTALTFRMRLA